MNSLLELVQVVDTTIKRILARFAQFVFGGAESRSHSFDGVLLKRTRRSSDASSLDEHHDGTRWLLPLVLESCESTPLPPPPPYTASTTTTTTITTAAAASREAIGASLLLPHAVGGGGLLHAVVAQVRLHVEYGRPVDHVRAAEHQRVPPVALALHPHESAERQADRVRSVRCAGGEEADLRP